VIQPQRNFRGMWWVVCGLFAVGLLAGAGYVLTRGHAPTAARAYEAREQAPVQTSGVSVEVTRPRKGGMDRTTTQPGTVQAYEQVQLFSEVSGYLKTQTVDIGDRVKRGQVLATIDVPELEKQVKRNTAFLHQTRARVRQMRARVFSAKADKAMALAAVEQAEANAKSADAWRRYREKQYGRMKDLFALKSIEERLVDESKDRYEASLETVRSARAAIATARAQVAAAEAKIELAEADVLGAETEVQVAQCDLEKSQILVQFATIVSPYDGVVTQRSLYPGGFVRAATAGGPYPPLLTVERTDKMRVVVQVPDRDVPYADVGDEAFFNIDALPGVTFTAKISRMEESEDPQTRLMRVEIDLPNPTGKVRRGMYGKVMIVLEKSANLLSVPSSCLVSRSEDGKGGVSGAVYVVREGRARRAPVKIGGDNGVRVAILQGLKSDDLVIRHPPPDLLDGMPVVIHPAEAAQGRAGH
jgi:RND family efflux transporter MFP subunit